MICNIILFSINYSIKYSSFDRKLKNNKFNIIKIYCLQFVFYIIDNYILDLSFIFTFYYLHKYQNIEC